jgi:hypothetical protein
MIEGVWLFLFFILVLMLVALAISHLLMPASLTLQDYHHLCLWLVRNINTNPINMYFSLAETGEDALNVGPNVFRRIDF